MEVEKINTLKDAQNYCEGLMNDYEAGISTKDETLEYLGGYTARLMHIFWEQSKKQIRANPELLK